MLQSELEKDILDSGEPADRVAFAAAKHGSLAPLSAFPLALHPLRRIPDSIFVPATRAMLQLPRKLQYDYVDRPGVDFPVDECAACPGKLIDAHSNHPQSCPLAHSARNERHRGLNDVIARYARDAGFSVKKEVLAPDLLAQNLPAADVANLIHGSRPDQRRMDLVLSDREQTLWVDGTVRHPLCERYVQLELANPGATVRAAVAFKRKTYGDLVKTAEAEAEEGHRTSAPRFFTAAMDTTGRLAVEFDRLIETIVKRREVEIMAEGVRMDGKPPPQVLRDFRRDFRTDLIFAMVRGNAKMILRAGRPRSFLRRNWRRG